MEFNYKIIQEVNLLVIKFDGEIFFDDLIGTTEVVYNDLNYRKDLIKIIDFRGCNVNMALKEIELIIEILKNEPRVEFTKSSILVDNPKSTFVSYLYQTLSVNSQSIAFSTWLAATEYLSVNINETILKNI